MKALWIVGIVLLVLLLLGLVRVGGAVNYSSGGVTVQILVGPLRVQVFPLRKRKRKHPPKEKKAAQRPEPEPKSETTGGSLALVREFLPLVTDAASSLRRKIRVDQLDMDLTVGAPNPAMAAIAFGGASAALGMLVPLLENAFQVKERNLRTDVDFNAKSPVIAIQAALTLTIGQIVAFTFHFGIRVLKVLVSHKKRQKERAGGGQES